MARNIVIVEDDRVVLTLIKNFVDSSNYNILAIFNTGEDLLRNIDKLEVDLILMDITLQGKLDGIQVATEVYTKYHIPFVYITSYVDDKTMERAKKSNAFGYIVKPFDKKDLKAGIEIALLRFSMEMEIKEKESRISTILKSIGDAVFVINQKGELTYLNPVAEKMAGVPALQLLNKKMKDVVKIENSTIKDWKNNIFSSGIEKNRNFLLNASGQRIPVEYSISPQLDDSGDSFGTVMVFRDISERVLAEDRLKESFDNLRTAMGGVIQAMAYTVETRDPYTAGHQKRVANLARKIGEKLNLDSEIIEGIRMAGVIHDLGKISVPSEILSKPGKISAVEFNLIKTHSQVAYDILKTVEFPWPIAEIVYQHHERNDGSGYPRGLKRDDLMIEARVISVADVVEAMASHRPYRPALGIDVALGEIQKHSGKWFDEEIVDACVSVFRDDDYTMDFK